MNALGFAGPGNSKKVCNDDYPTALLGFDNKSHEKVEDGITF